MTSHNFRQRCIGKTNCDCSACCMCWGCLFRRRSKSLYDGMQSRLKERKWKSGKKAGEVRVPKRELPFSLDEFRAWLKVTLEDEPSCSYCGTSINIQTISPDHAIPMARGGSLDRPNLRGSCEACNQLKGKLLPGEFKALLGLLMQFPEAARTDLTRRLRSGSMGVRLRFGPKKEAPAGSSVLALPAQRKEAS